MEEKEIKARIGAGRRTLRYDIDEENDFQSDQELKKPQPPLVKSPMRPDSLALPREFDRLTMKNDLTEIFAKRKSSRVYTRQPLSLLQLSWLLWVTQGVKEIRGKAYATLRTVPSGGARHGFETYLIVQNVEGLAAGRYHYLPMTHALEYLGSLENAEQVISESLLS